LSKQKIIEIMEVTHNIDYEGIDFEITGNYEEPEEETGYKGGFSYSQIFINSVDVTWMLNDSTIDRLVELVVEENY